MVTKNQRAKNVIALVKKDYISVVGLAFTLQKGEAKKLRTLAENSTEYEAVCFVDSHSKNPKFWYRKDQIDAMLRQVRTGTPVGQGELFLGVDPAVPGADKTVETTINTEAPSEEAKVEEPVQDEPTPVS